MRSVSKQGHLQLRCHSKAKSLSRHGQEQTVCKYSECCRVLCAEAKHVPYMYVHWSNKKAYIELSSINSADMYGLLTKCEVKMAGYWPSSFFSCFMDRDGVEVHKLAKKERGQYPAILTEQAWSMKDILYGFRRSFSCGTRRVVPSGQDSSISPARVANHSAGFDSSCPLTELAI